MTRAEIEAVAWVKRLPTKISVARARRCVAELRFTFTRDGDRLLASVNGGPPAPQLAEVKDVVFTSGRARVRKIFQRDASGAVVGLVYRREGHDILLKRLSEDRNSQKANPFSHQAAFGGERTPWMRNSPSNPSFGSSEVGGLLLRPTGQHSRRADEAP
jgi:hypothetical protein